MGDENDWSGHLSKKLDKVGDGKALVDVLHSLSTDVHVPPLIVHSDLVNTVGSMVDRLRRPDVAIELFPAVQRRHLQDVAVCLCSHKTHVSLHAK